jgi:hypothetical protein
MIKSLLASLHFAVAFLRLVFSNNFLLYSFLLLTRKLLLGRQSLGLLTWSCHCGFRLNLGSSRLLLHTGGSLSCQRIVAGADWLSFERLNSDGLLHRGCTRWWKIDWIVCWLVCAIVDDRLLGFSRFLLFLLDVCEAINAERYNLFLEVLHQHFRHNLHRVLLLVCDCWGTLAALHYLSSMFCLVQVKLILNVNIAAKVLR